MATKVELSTRTTRSDILNEAKPSRTYVSPLSDASNKSTDTSISSSLIIEDSVRNTSKTISMLNSGVRPRLSPKPFSREKPLEIRKSVGMPPTLSVDVKQHSDVPFQATTSISLSGSTKSNESERVGRRMFTSPLQTSTDEDQGNKSEGFSLTAAGRRPSGSSWPPGTNKISESISTQTDERKVTSKPPIVSRKPELLQQEKVYPSYSRSSPSDLGDESREPGDKSLEKAKSENIDSLTVRAQIRQKRRPVSAAFLESNDPVSDPKVADEPIKRWNRRPLSEDLTSLFEMIGVGNKKESPSEESKENRPFRKNSLSSITDEQSNVSSREGDYASDKNISSDTRMGVSGTTLKNVYSSRMEKEKSKDIPSNKQQQIADVGENEGVMKLSANMNNQSSTFHLDQYNGSSGEVKKSDDSGVAPGILKRRISLYTANTNSSEEVKVPLNTEDKNAANTERKTKSFVSDKETKSGTEWITSPSPTASTDFTKKFFNSPSKLDWKAEGPNEERRSSFSSQEYPAQKAKKEWQNTSLLEEKPSRPRLIRTNDEPVQYKENTEFSKDKRDYSYKDKLYDPKTNLFEETNKNSTQAEQTAKTVKATMFEHKIERHNPPEVYQSGNVMSSKPPKSAVTSERLQAKHESSSWLEWLDCKNVQSVAPIRKDLDIKDSKFSEKSVEIISSSTEDGNVQRMMLQSTKTFDENRRVEPKYEVVQAVTERALSESIQIALEDKAVTLRSRRSFHSKDWEQGKDGYGQSGTSLQRSKSEYRKRNTLNSPKENSQGRFFFTEKNEFSPSESLYKKESIFSSKNTSNDNKDFDFKEKVHESNKKVEKQEGTLEKYCSDYSQFGSSVTSKGEMKTPFRSDKLISSRSSIEKDSEKNIKTVKKDSTIANSNIRNEINYLTQEYKKQPSLNQFHPQKGLSTRNINKEESDGFTNAMLNTEIEEIKRELFNRRSSKEVETFQKKASKEELKEDTILLKSKDSFQDGEKSIRPSDMYKFERDDIKKKTPEFRIPYEKKDHLDITAVKDLSPGDKKVTYFAVTGIDGKRQRNDDGENQISSNTSFSEDFYFTHSVRMGRINLNSNSSSVTQEEKNTEKPIDTSRVLTGSTTYKNVQVLQDNFKEKSQKASESHSVVDALLKRHKQKPIVHDKSPIYLDTQTKPVQKSGIIEPENKTDSKAKESPLKLDGTYKSKAVDIDSLMADYNASQRKDKENKSRDDDLNFTKWERSRSFREGVSRGSSNKWKDPSARNFTYDEGYKYEPAGLRYTSSQETTSTKDDLKQALSKSPTLLDNFSTFAGVNHDKDLYKGNRESSVKTITQTNYKEHSTQSFDSMTTEAKSTSYMQNKQTIIKMSGDQSENRLADRVHQGSKHRETNPEEKTQTLSESKKTAKSSDLIGLMLENREKRIEQLRSRQRVPVDLPQEPEMHQIEARQDWTYSDSKDYRKKEELKQHPTRIREMEVTTDFIRRKSLNRHKEYTASSAEEGSGCIPCAHPWSKAQDHVKQCFSRSSTSNKDTDSLVQETDRQYGTWSQDKQQPGESFAQESYDINSRKRQSHSRLSSLSHTETDQHDSFAEARDGSLDRSSMDLDSTDGTASTPSFHEAKAVDFSFMDTSVLDSTALKNRVQLSRKSQRRAPSQLQRRSRLLVTSSQLEVIEDTDSPWMFTDSTEPEPEKKDEVEEEEEKPQRSSLQSQRMPMFPGMDHSTLMAQLRKRQEAESGSESSTQPSSPQASAQPSRSPKSPLPQGTLGVKLLPTSADIQDRGASASPQWLKELKSKKRQSQYENQS
ncbi:uncharacterized protein KIAA1671 homolog isoform X2 [Hyla sarda]|uniref:uncharacterized protein KIAA1671 homolog isoform X2 n=1 Tax=Hyla sarda TaxID=327740 RepID=UPI0024C34896|nr:uncharacterized protein KIAA1671 homolog isoform X2 [Hyla sarda]